MQEKNHSLHNNTQNCRKRRSFFSFGLTTHRFLFLAFFLLSAGCIFIVVETLREGDGERKEPCQSTQCLDNNLYVYSASQVHRCMKAFINLNTVDFEFRANQLSCSNSIVAYFRMLEQKQEDVNSFLTQETCLLKQMNDRIVLKGKKNFDQKFNQVSVCVHLEDKKIFNYFPTKRLCARE